MARPAKFTTDDILDAAAQAVVRHGHEVTLTHIATELGGPVGSLYHRFSSRDALLVSLWMRSVRRFHEGFLCAATGADAQQAALDCAVHVPHFSRLYPADAAAMTLYRQPDLVTRAPEELRADVSHINDRVFAAIRELTQRRFGSIDEFHLTLVLTACEESPYGLVRRYITSRTPIPAWLDDAVRSSTRAILSLGDG